MADIQKLDDFNKILLATGQINYMASSIYLLNQQMKMVLDKEGYHAEGIKQRDEILSSVIKELGEIMEEMGNLLNAHDSVCAIDMRVAKVPFEIIIEGKDETENDYEKEN